MIDYGDFLTNAPVALLLLGYSAPAAFGFFCAYWAQQTRRNPWLWFFFGTLLTPLAGVTLLALNRDRLPPPGRGLGDPLAVRKDLP